MQLQRNFLLFGCLLLMVQTSMGYSEDSPQQVDATSARAHSSLQSFVDRRDAGLVRQRRDFSCGAAALATLLTYQWHDPVEEDDLLLDFAGIIPAEELERRYDDGFSLYDLQRVARSRGYGAQGYRMNAEQLPKLSGPVIVFIEPFGYKHFAVLRGIAADRAVLADPSRGNITVPLYQFHQWWLGESGQGIVFAVEPLLATPETLRTGGMNLGPGEGARPALMDSRALLPDAPLRTPSMLLTR